MCAVLRRKKLALDVAHFHPSHFIQIFDLHSLPFWLCTVERDQGAVSVSQMGQNLAANQNWSHMLLITRARFTHESESP